MKYEIEKLLNICIPEQIKAIIELNNDLIVFMDEQKEIFKVISVDKLLEVYKEQEELFGYKIVPFAFLDDDYLCLFYKKSSISIIYWSTERALESKEMAIFELYSSYEDFIKQLKQSLPPRQA